MKVWREVREMKVWREVGRKHDKCQFFLCFCQISIDEDTVEERAALDDLKILLTRGDIRRRWSLEQFFSV